MDTNKLFNNWIDREFYGLSAHTLYQVLVDEMPQELYTHFNNLVYIDLYKYFCGCKSDVAFNAYKMCKEIVASFFGLFVDRDYNLVKESHISTVVEYLCQMTREPNRSLFLVTTPKPCYNNVKINKES